MFRNKSHAIGILNFMRTNAVTNETEIHNLANMIKDVIPGDAAEKDRIFWQVFGYILHEMVRRSQSTRLGAEALKDMLENEPKT
jgi:hypothetical protein